MNKSFVTLFSGIILSGLVTLTVFAGQWKHDTAGWWYQRDNGTWPAGGWEQIDGSWYYFYSNGYMANSAWIDGLYYVGSDGRMLVNTTTPDGYQVGTDGRWVGAGENNTSLTSIDYMQVYRSAWNDAIQRHNILTASGELDPIYNRMWCQLCDITGDGVKELLIGQAYSKHGMEYGVYGLQNGIAYRMGDFEADTSDEICAGYRPGVILMEDYKGSQDLFYQEWTGSGFVRHELYSGSYDYWGRGNGPEEGYTFSALSGYYDPNRIIDYPVEISF